MGVCRGTAGRDEEGWTTGAKITKEGANRVVEKEGPNEKIGS